MSRFSTCPKERNVAKLVMQSTVHLPQFYLKPGLCIAGFSPPDIQFLSHRFGFGNIHVFSKLFEATQVVRACLRLTCAMCGGLVIFCWFGRAKLTHLLLPDEPVTQAIFAKLLICGWASSHVETRVSCKSL